MSATSVPVRDAAARCRRGGTPLRAAGVLLAALLAGCAAVDSRTVADAPAGAQPAAAAQQPSRQAFASPEEAVVALIDACRTGEPEALEPLFGADADDFAADDPAEVGADMQRLAAAYDRQHLLVVEDDGSVTLWIGARQWAFPAPLVKGAAGWTFDGATGAAVMRERAMEDNEAGAARYLLQLAAAPDSPRDEPDAPLSGYRFRVLDAAPGSVAAEGASARGATIVAWPDRYGEDGRSVFVLAPDGRVYERDFGEAQDAGPLADEASAIDASGDWTPYPVER